MNDIDDSILLSHARKSSFTTSTSNSSRRSVSKTNFQNVAQNMLTPPIFQNPFAYHQMPMDILPFDNIINKKTEEEDELEVMANQRYENKFMQAINKQNEILEKLTSSLAKEKEESINDQQRFFNNKLKKLDNFEFNPKEFYREEKLNERLLNDDNSRRILDPIEMMHRFKKYKDKRKAFDPPQNYPPFLNPVGAPWGMNELPLEMISHPFENALLQDASFGMSPYKISPQKNNLIKNKGETEKQEKYNKIMKFIVTS